MFLFTEYSTILILQAEDSGTWKAAKTLEQLYSGVSSPQFPGGSKRAQMLDPPQNLLCRILPAFSPSLLSYEFARGDPVNPLPETHRCVRSGQGSQAGEVGHSWLLLLIFDTVALTVLWSIANSQHLCTLDRWFAESYLADKCWRITA